MAGINPRETKVRLKNKIALVTGAAWGMGESAARIFAREGAKVACADILEKEGAAVAASIASAGGEAMFLRIDVSDEEQWRECVRATVKRYGRLDVLVNNAGISGAVPERMSTEYFDKLMAVNARGTFLGMKYAIPEMQKAGGGVIVNLSSISGFVGQEFVHMGYNGVTAVHVGKYLEIELHGADKDIARTQLDEACHKFLSNPVIEDYRLEIE